MANSEITFRPLGIEYIDEIFNLLNSSYCNSKITQFIFSKKYLYWYLKDIPCGNIIGMVSNGKLIGITTIYPIDFIIGNNKIKISLIGLQCIHYKLQSDRILKLLTEYIHNQLKGTTYAYTQQVETEMGECFIPINQKKLLKLDFLTELGEDICQYSSDQLRLLKEEDMETVSNKLIKHYENYDCRPLFNCETCQKLFLPKKHVVYSFVTSDLSNFISVYKNFYWCPEKKIVISNAILSFCYNETLDITELMIELSKVLRKFKFDQLIIRDPRIYQNVELVKYIGYVNYHTSIMNHLDVIYLPFN